MAATGIEGKKKKQRSKNFSVDEENLIQSMVERHTDILSSKFSNDVTNRNKSEIWQQITDSVNMKGVALCTVSQVKEKWGNMTQKAKNCFTENRKQRGMTGGGPPPPELGTATDKIIDLMKDTASFNGVPGGIDSVIISDHIAEDSNSLPTSSSVTPIISFDGNVEQIAGTSIQGDEEAIATLPESCAAVPIVVSVVSNSEEGTTRASNSSKRKRKSRPTQEDVLEKQCEVLEGQLQQQELEKETTQLETQKLKLQIKLLEKMLMKQDEIDLGGFNPSEILLSLMN